MREVLGTEVNQDDGIATGSSEDDGNPHTFTKPVVSSPNRSWREKHSQGGSFRSPFKHASTNLKAAIFATFGVLEI